MKKKAFQSIADHPLLKTLHCRKLRIQAVKIYFKRSRIFPLEMLDMFLSFEPFKLGIYSTKKR